MGRGGNKNDAREQQKTEFANQRVKDRVTIFCNKELKSSKEVINVKELAVYLKQKY